MTATDPLHELLAYLRELESGKQRIEHAKRWADALLALLRSNEELRDNAARNVTAIELAIEEVSALPVRGGGMSEKRTPARIVSDLRGLHCYHWETDVRMPMRLGEEAAELIQKLLPIVEEMADLLVQGDVFGRIDDLKDRSREALS